MSDDVARDSAASLGSVSERDGRHAFMVIEAIAQEADRLGIRAVDIHGNGGSVVDFFDKIIRYIKGRDGECEKLTTLLRLADAAARANPPALTDAEREAISDSIAVWTQALASNEQMYEKHAAALRGLLERHK
jgi:hypothetical protein